MKSKSKRGGSRSIVRDAKRESSGKGGRRTLGRDFGSCCEEGGFESRRGRSPGYPRKRSRRWWRARRGRCRRRWRSPGTPRRRSGGVGVGRRRRRRLSGTVAGWLARSLVGLVHEERRTDAGGGQAEDGRGGRARCGPCDWLRVVTEARVTGPRRALFYSGRCLRWGPYACPPRVPFGFHSSLSPRLPFVGGGGASPVLPLLVAGWLAGWRARTLLHQSGTSPTVPWGRCGTKRAQSSVSQAGLVQRASFVRGWRRGGALFVNRERGPLGHSRIAGSR
jgi:hypothetical protein